MSAHQAPIQELLRLAAAFRQHVKVKDRRYLFRTYRRCFVGQEAVAWMVASGWAADTREAVWLGRQLLCRLGLFHHVRYEHTFQDDYLFYRFTEDDVELREAVSLRRQLSSSRTGARRSEEHAPEPKMQHQQQQQHDQGAKQPPRGAPHGGPSSVSVSASAGDVPKPPGLGKGMHGSGGLPSPGSLGAAAGTHGSLNAAWEPGGTAWPGGATTRGSHNPDAAGGGLEAQPAPSVGFQTGVARGASRGEGDGAGGATAVVDWGREVLQGHVRAMQEQLSRMEADAEAQRSLVHIVVSELDGLRAQVSELNAAAAAAGVTKQPTNVQQAAGLGAGAGTELLTAEERQGEGQGQQQQQQAPYGTACTAQEAQAEVEELRAGLSSLRAVCMLLCCLVIASSAVPVAIPYGSRALASEPWCAQSSSLEACVRQQGPREQLLGAVWDWQLVFMGLRVVEVLLAGLAALWLWLGGVGAEAVPRARLAKGGLRRVLQLQLSRRGVGLRSPRPGQQHDGGAVTSPAQAAAAGTAAGGQVGVARRLSTERSSTAVATAAAAAVGADGGLYGKVRRSLTRLTRGSLDAVHGGAGATGGVGAEGTDAAAVNGVLRPLATLGCGAQPQGRHTGAGSSGAPPADQGGGEHSNHGNNSSGSSSGTAGSSHSGGGRGGGGTVGYGKKNAACSSPTLSRRALQYVRLCTAPLRLHLKPYNAVVGRTELAATAAASPLEARAGVSLRAEDSAAASAVDAQAPAACALAAADAAPCSSAAAACSNAAAACADGYGAAELGKDEDTLGLNALSSFHSLSQGDACRAVAPPPPQQLRQPQSAISPVVPHAEEQRACASSAATGGPPAGEAAASTASLGDAVVPTWQDFATCPDAPVLLALHVGAPPQAGGRGQLQEQSSSRSSLPTCDRAASPNVASCVSDGTTSSVSTQLQMQMLQTGGQQEGAGEPSAPLPSRPRPLHVVPANTQLPSEAIRIESELFSGVLHVLLRGLPSTDEALFVGRKRLSWAVMQGRFKVPLAVDGVVTGQEFCRPFARLPAPWFVERVLLALARKISPSMRVGPLSAPHLLVPILAAAQLVNVSRPGEEPDPIHCHEDVRLFCPALSTYGGARPATAEARRRHFTSPRSRAGLSYDTQHVWTFHFWQQHVDLATYRLNFGYTYDLVRHLDGQPLQVMVRDVQSGRYLYNVLVWNERLLKQQHHHHKQHSQDKQEALEEAAGEEEAEAMDTSF